MFNNNKKRKLESEILQLEINKLSIQKKNLENEIEMLVERQNKLVPKEVVDFFEQKRLIDRKDLSFSYTYDGRCSITITF